MRSGIAIHIRISQRTETPHSVFRWKIWRWVLWWRISKGLLTFHVAKGERSGFIWTICPTLRFRSGLRYSGIFWPLNINGKSYWRIVEIQAALQQYTMKLIDADKISTILKKMKIITNWFYVVVTNAFSAYVKIYWQKFVYKANKIYGYLLKIILIAASCL